MEAEGSRTDQLPTGPRTNNRGSARGNWRGESSRGRGRGSSEADRGRSRGNRGSERARGRGRGAGIDRNLQRSGESVQQSNERAREIKFRELQVLRQASEQFELKALREAAEQFEENCGSWIGDVNEIREELMFDYQQHDVAYAVLGRQIRGLWESARPSRKDLANRQSIITRLQNLISSNWPQDNLQVSSFGSSLTGLSTTTSDLDLVLLDPSHSRGIGTPPNQVRFRRSNVVMIDGRPEWESVGVLSRLLSRKGKQYGFAAIQKIAHASIPIVKFIDQSTGIHVDLNCNDRFGIANSKLISTYAQIRESLVKPLMYFIKFWSKAKDLNDPTGRKGPGGATFSSYSLCLMVIHYLQQDFQLPYLQSKDALARCGITKENHNQEYAYLRPPKKRFARDREREERQRNSIPSTVCDLSFAQDISQFEEYLELEGEDNQSRRDVELGKHTLGFFEYFAKFDRKKFGVSILYRTLELKPKDRIKNDDVTSSSAQDLTEKLQSLDINSTRELSFRARNPEQYSASSGDPAPAPNLPGLGGNPDTVFPPQTQEWMDTSWVTQDPLIITRNTSRALHEPSSIRFETELKLAIESIRLGEWISVVCEDVRIKKLEVLENQKHSV